MSRLLVYGAEADIEYSGLEPSKYRARIQMPRMVQAFGITTLEVIMATFVEPLGAIDVRNAPYNADGTGVADATDAINAASDDAKATGAVLMGMGGVFRIDGTVNLKTHCNFHGAVFVGASGVNHPVIRIADDDVYLKRLRNKIMYLPKVSKSRFTNLATVGGYSTWPNDDDGVRIEGLSRSIVFFDEIEFCRCGIHIVSVDTSDVHTTGSVTGTDFCQFYITNVNGCQTNLWLDVKQIIAGENSGWINENSFYGGSLRHENITYPAGQPIPGCYQIRLTGWGNSEGYGTPNHNSFHRVSVEGNAHEYSVYCQGHANNFDDLRWERFDPYPSDRIFVGKPGGSPSWMGGWGNRFSGFKIEQFTDPLDSYGYIEIGVAGQSPNYAQSVRHIGRADDLGGGWVQLVDNTP